MSFRIVIPARYASERLPGKPLCEIDGQPMLQHVYRRAAESSADEVVVATDDERIATAARAFGAAVKLTSAAHRSGTDRAAEVAVAAGWADDDIVVNVQGDEPLLPPANIDQVARLLAQSDAGIATLAWPIETDAEMRDPNVVKVVADRDGNAMYFSRAPIPWLRDAGATDSPGSGGWRHIGLYAYRVGALARLAATPPCALERIERLEQLRALWVGMKIRIDLAGERPAAGVDTAADLERITRLISQQTEKEKKL